MSKIEVDKVDPQSGTALEIGTSGDTITVPSGVTLTTTNATVNLPASVAGLGTGITNAQLAGSIDVTTKITGVVPAANLGTGTASSSTVLYGDGTFKTEPGGLWTELHNSSPDTVTSLDMTDVFSSAYDVYKLFITNWYSTTSNAHMSANIITAAGVQTGSVYTDGWILSYVDYNGTLSHSQLGNYNASRWDIGAPSLYSATSQTQAAITFGNMHSTTAWKVATANVYTNENNATILLSGSGGMIWRDTTAATGLRLITEGGGTDNLTIGRVQLLGLKNS
jgi:hypothetical protein